MLDHEGFNSGAKGSTFSLVGVTAGLTSSSDPNQLKEDTMTKFIRVNAVVGTQMIPGDQVDESEVTGEDDGAEDPQPTEPGVRELTLPTLINLEHVRSFNQRKGDRIGTRFVFVNKTALPVTETLDQVLELIAEANRS